jgi:uncharacterized protein YdhG (YjbR/CyaY superfamily)
MNEDVQHYIDQVQDERRSLFDRLQALIFSLCPDATVVMSYQVPTYRFMRGWVALGYWKKGVSLYTNGPHNIAQFKAAYPDIKTGKGSINFKVADELPVAALEQVVRHAVEQRN